MIHTSLQLYVVVLKCIKSAIWLKQNISVFNCQLWFLFHPEDFDDCSMWGVCDQLCEDRIGSHRCSCREGYVLEQHRYCRADVSSESFPSLFEQIFLTCCMLRFWMCERSIKLTFISIAPFPVGQPLWLLHWAAALLSGALLRTECCFSYSLAFVEHRKSVDWEADLCAFSFSEKSV